MKKLLVVILVLCIGLAACGRKADETANAEDTSCSQLVSVTYAFESDFGDMLVKLLNSASIKQKIGIEADNVNKITVERVKEREEHAADGKFNNVIKITADAGDKELSEKLLDTFCDKAEQGISSIIKNNEITIKKVDQ